MLINEKSVIAVEAVFGRMSLLKKRVLMSVVKGRESVKNVSVMQNTRKESGTKRVSSEAKAKSKRRKKTKKEEEERGSMGVVE